MDDNSTSTAPVDSQAPDTVAPEGQVAEGEKQEENQPQPQATKKKFKLKVDGQEIEEEIDLADDETIKRHLQMSKAAQKRMSEAAQTKRQAEQFINALRTNPLKILNDPNLGLDFKKIAEDYIYEQAMNDMLTPEQKQLKEYERRLKEHEDQQRTAKEQQEAQQLEELQQRYAEDYDKKITEALSTSGLPKTPKTVKRMAELMYKNLEFGFELEPKQLVEIVRQDYLTDIKELLMATDGDSLLKMLGDETANKLRKADLARLKSAKPEFTKSETKQEVASAPKRTMSTDEWFEEVRKRAMS